VQRGRKQQDYWRRNLSMTALLLAIWFVVTFVTSYFARDLADISLLGLPLGFYVCRSVSTWVPRERR